MKDKIICLLLGHRWQLYPRKSVAPDFKVCDRCDKSIASSPYLTAGEVDYIDHALTDALSANLIARSSLFNEKGEDNGSES